VQSDSPTKNKTTTNNCVSARSEIVRIKLTVLKFFPPERGPCKALRTVSSNLAKNATSNINNQSEASKSPLTKKLRQRELRKCSMHFCLTCEWYMTHTSCCWHLFLEPSYQFGTLCIILNLAFQVSDMRYTRKEQCSLACISLATFCCSQ
jgi:hypothetical protein